MPSIQMPALAPAAQPLDPSDALVVTPSDIMLYKRAHPDDPRDLREIHETITATRCTREVFLAILVKNGGLLHHSNPSVSCFEDKLVVKAARTNGVLAALIADGTVEDTGWDIQLQPRVGMAATVRGYSDAYAYTVIKVTPKSATLRRVKATLLNGVDSGESDALSFSPGGFSGHTSGRQRYLYEEDPDGETIRVTKRKRGAWRTAGAGTGSSRVAFGKHSEHYDFNF